MPKAIFEYPAVLLSKVFGPKATLEEILPPPKPKFIPLIEPEGTSKDPLTSINDPDKIGMVDFVYRLL